MSDSPKGTIDRENSPPIKLIPGQAEMLALIRPNVLGERRWAVGNTAFRYLVFRRIPGGPGACWDADGRVYIPDQDEFIGSDERR